MRSRRGRNGRMGLRLAGIFLAALLLLFPPLLFQPRKEGGKAPVEAVMPPTREEEIQTFIRIMTLEEQAAQLFLLTPEAWQAAGGEALPVGGLIYFSQNIPAPQELKEETARLQALALDRWGIPLFLSIDEEGGQITRIAGAPGFQVPRFPPLNNISTLEEAYHLGNALGSYLEAYGFNMDFAPVADVWTNPGNTVVRNRAFSSDPRIVAELVEGELLGFQGYQVIPVLKHFPGHGATTGDTHDGFAYTGKDRAALLAWELIPFQRGIAAGARAVMVGHFSLPNVLGDGTPASLSPLIIEELLRRDLGFQGLVITDALNMGAITRRYPPEEAAVLALAAGTDLLLMPEDFQAAYGGVLEAIRSGRISQERLEQSLFRIFQTKMEALSWQPGEGEDPEGRPLPETP